MKGTQKTVSQDQITAFYHDLFVENQVEYFIAFSGFSVTRSFDNIVDKGGGCGIFRQGTPKSYLSKCKSPRF
jgi:hypothetical protein